MITRDIRGVWYALCVNNDKMNKLGSIGVRIPGLEGGFVYDNINKRQESIYDVIANPDITQNEDKMFWCRVLTPFGGMPRTGMLFIPEVGSWGAVSFLENDVKTGLWLGGVTGLHYNGSYVTNHVPAGFPAGDELVYEPMPYHTKNEQDSTNAKKRYLLRADPSIETEAANFAQLSDEFVLNFKKKVVPEERNPTPAMLIKGSNDGIEFIIGDYSNGNYSKLKISSSKLIYSVYLNKSLQSQFFIDNSGATFLCPAKFSGSVSMSERTQDSFVKFKPLRDIISLLKAHVHPTSQGDTTESVDLAEIVSDFEEVKTSNIKMG